MEPDPSHKFPSPLPLRLPLLREAGGGLPGTNWSPAALLQLVGSRRVEALGALRFASCKVSAPRGRQRAPGTQRAPAALLVVAGARHTPSPGACLSLLELRSPAVEAPLQQCQRGSSNSLWRAHGEMSAFLCQDDENQGLAYREATRRADFSSTQPPTQRNPSRRPGQVC